MNLLTLRKRSRTLTTGLELLVAGPAGHGILWRTKFHSDRPAFWNITERSM
jgi:hypothetical protein